MYMYVDIKVLPISSIPLGSKGVQTWSVIQTTILVNYNRYSLEDYYSLFLEQWNLQESVYTWVSSNILYTRTEGTYYTLE